MTIDKPSQQRLNQHMYQIEGKPDSLFIVVNSTGHNNKVYSLPVYLALASAGVQFLNSPQGAQHRAWHTANPQYPEIRE